MPIIEEFILRRLLIVPQDEPLNPVFVRSPARIILMLDSLAPGLPLIGTFWLPLVILIDLLARRAMITPP